MPTATIENERPRTLGPVTWIASLVVHALLVILVATSAGRWLGPPSELPGGGGGEMFHSVGVVVESSPTDRPDKTADESDRSDDRPAERAAGGSRQAGAPGSEVPAEAPAELELPSRDPKGIGAGSLTPSRSGVPNDVFDPVRDGGIRNPGALSGLAAGETRFFGIRDKGARIVYVIDVSGSMVGPKLNSARTQLLASLQTLLPKQRFQVLLYDHRTMPMTLDDTAGPFPATDVNKTKTRQYLGGLQHLDGGTDREQALMKSLAYSPDVVYFLTDGDAVELDRARRTRILRRNDTAGARIHCIEFGEGPAPTVRTTLGKLANENGGVYRYVRVGQLGS